MNKYAYIRVSSKDQNAERQIVAMKKIGLIDEQIYIDKQSGKNFDRENYQKMIKRLKIGDEIYIKSIDRLGRNYEDIIDQWNYLTKIKNVEIIVLDFPLLDTRSKSNCISRKLISDLFIKILSYVAQMERENIKQRQAEGIKIAKEKGIKFGRPILPISKDFEEIYKLYLKKQISRRAAAKRLGISPVTFSNWIKRYEKLNSPPDIN